MITKPKKQPKKYNYELYRGNYKVLAVRLSPDTFRMVEELAFSSNLSVSNYIRALIKGLYISTQMKESPDGSLSINLWEGKKVTIPKKEVAKMIKGLENTFSNISYEAFVIEEKKPKVRLTKKVKAA